MFKGLEGALTLAEASLTCELLDQVLFLGLKGIGSIYLDERGGHALRVIPARLLPGYTVKYLSFLLGATFTPVRAER